MFKFAGTILLISGLSLLTGCSSPRTYGGQAYAAPAVDMSPAGNGGYQANPTNFQPVGPIASGPGCNCQQGGGW